MFIINEPIIIVRKIHVSDKQSVYLTFDDGPDQATTLELLDLLKIYNAKATFFVIGESARKNKKIIQRIENDSHAIASHSIDHNYSHYFRNTEHLSEWIIRSLADLKQLSPHSLNAFRPPAGIITPPLIKAANALNIPLILWRHRFFDSLFKINKKKLINSVQNYENGDIFLLHDRQKEHNRKDFLIKVELLLNELSKKSANFEKLNF